MTEGNPGYTFAKHCNAVAGEGTQSLVTQFIGWRAHRTMAPHKYRAWCRDHTRMGDTLASLVPLKPGNLDPRGMVYATGQRIAAPVKHTTRLAS